MKPVPASAGAGLSGAEAQVRTVMDVFVGLHRHLKLYLSDRDGSCLLTAPCADFMALLRVFSLSPEPQRGVVGDEKIYKKEGDSTHLLFLKIKAAMCLIFFSFLVIKVQKALRSLCLEQHRKKYGATT